jgi:aspartyl-tRNA(Asn)/glutamyl-tRNA(Gln) amidotransferase subunit B
MAKNIFATMLSGKEKSAKKIAAAGGMKQVSDAGEIGRAIDAVIAANPDNVKKYRDGKVQVFGWFVGQVLKETKGRANPEMVNTILKDRLA